MTSIANTRNNYFSSKIIFRELIIPYSDYIKLEEKIGKYVCSRSMCTCWDDNCEDMDVKFKFLFVPNEMGEWVLDKTRCSDEQYHILKNLYGTS